jgi:LPXTG-motif cell wall-anchored protein
LKRISWEGPLKVFGSILFLLGLAGTASASVVAPGPELDTGILGMAMAAGAIYLLKRRKRG